MKLMPDQPVPALAVDTLAGKRFDIAAQTPKNFTQIVFYRGMHCPVCKNYLRSIDARLADFQGHGRPSRCRWTAVNAPRRRRRPGSCNG